MIDAGDLEPAWAEQLPTDDTSLDDAAVAYAELGFRVLPVWGVRRGRDGAFKCLCGKRDCKAGKHPIGDRWEKLASSDVDRVRRARDGKPGSNIGLAMGGAARLVAVDVDGPEGRASLESLEAAHGPLPVTLTSATGRPDGGEHRVFRLPETLDITRLRNRASVNTHTGIDTRVAGGQIVVAPSRHETGALYRWTVRAPISDMPEWLYEALATPLATVTHLPPRAPSSRPATSGTGRIADFRWRYVEKALDNAASDIAACPPGQRNDKLFAKSCTIFEYFVGEGYDASIAHQRLFEAGRACGMSPGEVRGTLAKAASRAQKSPRRVPTMPERPDHAYQPEDGSGAADVPFETRAREHEDALGFDPEDEDEAWEADLEHDPKGNLRCSLANLVTILSRHPDWRGVIVWDDFAQAVVKRRLPPVREGDRTPKLAVGEWTEGDTGRAVTWISANLKIDASARAIEEALLVVAERASCNPVREYLAGLTWDGVARIDGFLTSHFRCPDTEYVRGVSYRWLISAVARAFEPGCDVDCVLVFEGSQGSGKSKGLRALVPERAWFADTPLVIGDKDSYQNLRGKWIYEIGELAGLKGRDVERTKNFLSASVDNLRPSFGKRNRDHVRALVFAASTNDHHYLTDRTGNRRFWPVRVTSEVDREAIIRDRDQIWAEAVHRYRQGERWHADTPEFRALAREEQAEREPDSPWRGVVERWLETPWVTTFDPSDGMKQTVRADLDGEGVTTTEVLQSAIGMALDRIDRRHETEMGQLLREIGLREHRPRGGNGRQRKYRRLGSVDPGPTGGGGLDQGWTRIPESNQQLTNVVQPVQPISSFGESQPKKEEPLLQGLQLPPPIGLDRLDQTAFLGGSQNIHRASDGGHDAETASGEPASPSDREQASIASMLSRVRLPRGNAPTNSDTGTHAPRVDAPPRAPALAGPRPGGQPSPRPTLTRPAQGPSTRQGGGATRPPPEGAGEDEPEDFLAWLDRT